MILHLTRWLKKILSLLCMREIQWVIYWHLQKLQVEGLGNICSLIIWNCRKRGENHIRTWSNHSIKEGRRSFCPQWNLIKKCQRPQTTFIHKIIVQNMILLKILVNLLISQMTHIMEQTKTISHLSQISILLWNLDLTRKIKKSKFHNWMADTLLKLCVKK